MEQPPADGIGGGVGSRRVSRREVDEDSWQLDRLGPLLRDMVAFGIVQRNDAGVFELRTDVQRWLAEASSRLAHPTTAEVFVGRPCQRCGTFGVTRMVDGARLCVACQATPAEEPAGEPAPGHHHARRWRARKAG